MKESGIKPRRHRYPTELRAFLRLPDGDVRALLTDLSDEGFCIHTDETLPIGKRVDLFEERLGTLSGRVRWSFQGRAGCRFVSNEADGFDGLPGAA